VVIGQSLGVDVLSQAPKQRRRALDVGEEKGERFRTRSLRVAHVLPFQPLSSVTPWWVLFRSDPTATHALPDAPKLVSSQI
jgi:hypothetical protein